MKKLSSLFQDKVYILFVLFIFLFYIIFYQYIDYNTKVQIYKILSNPLMFLSVLVLICFVLYNHLTLGIILILSFLLSLTCGSERNQNNTNNNTNDNTNTNTNNNTNTNTNDEGFKDFFKDNLKSMTNYFEQAMNENKELELNVKKKNKKKIDQVIIQNILRKENLIYQIKKIKNYYIQNKY